MSTPSLSQVDSLHDLDRELKEGMKLAKCHSCGCMQDALRELGAGLASVATVEAADLACRVEKWQTALKPMEYTCLGRRHCYGATAQNMFAMAFPDTDAGPGLDCTLQTAHAWPPVVGEYVVVDSSAPVAVSLLASVDLVDSVVQLAPPSLAIIGKTETENIGLDKIIKNVVSNPQIRHLIVAGNESQGHSAGQTLLALGAHGVDEDGRVIHAPGKRPVLRNVTRQEVETFRTQVEITDMIGCVDAEQIALRIAEVAAVGTQACTCCDFADSAPDEIRHVSVPPGPSRRDRTLEACGASVPVKLDRAGYFVIVPRRTEMVIYVEHYDYEHALLRTLRGATAKALYATIVEQGWVTELSHAAYLGRELARAEMALADGQAYVQDGA